MSRTEPRSYPQSRAADPLVTLFVTGYNQERGITEGVKSALRQTYTPLQIVLADDGSTDRTFEIMQRLAAEYDGPHEVIAITGENRGIAGNVNRVMEHAKGELIVQSNGNDTSEPHRVARIVEVWIASGRSIKSFHSARRVVDGDGNFIGICHGPRSLVENPSPEHFARYHMAACGATAAWAAEVFAVFGPLPDYAMLEDTIIPFRASLLGEVRFIDEPLVTWHLGGVSSAELVSGVTGESILQGSHLEWAKRHLANCRSFHEDVEAVAYRGRDRVRHHTLRFMLKRQHHVRLSESDRPALLSMLPRSMYLAVRYADSSYLKLNICYLFPETYKKWKGRAAARRPQDGRRLARIFSELDKKYVMEV